MTSAHTLRFIMLFECRLVAMLAEIGQKGGILRVVGKVALLWGGIRGAMSLTDKLISFLHLSERPLPHRLVTCNFILSFLLFFIWHFLLAKFS